MNYYFVGMDIGDAESVVAIRSLGRQAEPMVIPEACLPTALLLGGRNSEPKIGYEALDINESAELDVSFKHNPTEQYSLWRIQAGKILLYAEELYKLAMRERPELQDGHQVFIGCPAGWSAVSVNSYESLVTESSVLTGAVIVRESRGALLQAWEFENLPSQTLAVGVIVIDIGSSTIDCSVVRDGTASEHQASTSFGLRDLDDRIFQAYLDQHPAAAERRAIYGKQPSAENYMRYLCRLHKERAFGATPNLSRLLAGRTWLRDEWDQLEEVNVLGLLVEPGGWLDRYRGVLAKLAEDHSLEGTTVLLTGGGANIPQVIEATRDILPRCRAVKVAQDPMTGVAKGLAAYGWLDRTVAEFEDSAKRLLCSETAMSRVRQLYPGFLSESFDYIKRGSAAIPEISWKDIIAGQIRLPNGDLTSDAKSVFESWTRNLEESSVLSKFSRSITEKLEQDFDEVATGYGLPVGEWRPEVRLEASELIASQDTKKDAALPFFIVSVLLPFSFVWARTAFAGRLGLHTLLKVQKLQPTMTADVIKLFDVKVTQAIERAVTDSLGSVRGMLLDANRS
jgi:hypothetical protein